VRKPIAVWISEDGIWLDAQASHLFEPFQLYSAIWSKSGMMLGGQAYELPTSEHHITGHASLLLATPQVIDSTGGAKAASKAQVQKLQDQAVELAFDNGLPVSPAITASLLPTPLAQDYRDGKYLRNVAKDAIERGVNRGFSLNNVTEAITIEDGGLLPTPTLSHLRNHDEPVEDYLQRRQDYLDGKTSGMPGASLGVAIRLAIDPDNLLPTPLVDDSKNTGHNENRYPTLASEMYKAADDTNWGKYEPAIRRWEIILGRPAPAPTRPDGKDGTHRLSPLFTEWMMGLPAGWITRAGLKRNEELKLCGNGVVPQQAMLALSILFEDLPDHIKLSTD